LRIWGALENLERALKVPTDGELVLEGTIHRFEIAIELFWKTLSRALQFRLGAPPTPVGVSYLPDAGGVTGL
jgi:hypothetical protein